MNTRHASSHGAINLFYNGGWALSKDGVPAMWLFENLAAEGLNTYNLVDERLHVSLTGTEPSTILQDFSTFAAPLDIAIPINNGEVRGLAAGYKVAEGRPIPVKTALTVAFDVEREIGDISFKVFFTIAGNRYYVSSDTSSIAVGHPHLVRRVRLEDKVRLHFTILGDIVPTLTQAPIISSIGIEMSAADASSFYIDKIMLATGASFELPYTGDPFIHIFPKDCIIMTLGDVCPPGFEELGEGDLNPIADWGTTEPGINARLGNYPRSGTELAGSPVHTTRDPQVQDARIARREFEGFEGRLFTEYANSPDNVDPNNPGTFAFTVYASNADIDQDISHTHDVSESFVRPASLGLRFCKRL